MFDEDVLADLEPEVRLRLITTNIPLADSRKASGMTQPEFALEVKMGLQRYQLIESLRVVPSEEEKVRISVALKQVVDYLFPEHLMDAVNRGVFARRKVELTAPQVMSLNEAAAAHLLPPVSEEDDLLDELEKGQMRLQIKKCLSTLAPREAQVIRIKFGLDDGRSRTFEEVGKEFDVSRERIRQIETKALRKLRHPSRSRMLKGFLTDEPICDKGFKVVRSEYEIRLDLWEQQRARLYGRISNYVLSRLRWCYLKGKFTVAVDLLSDTELSGRFSPATVAKIRKALSAGGKSG